jgi:hypothetical protein
MLKKRLILNKILSYHNKLFLYLVVKEIKLNILKQPRSSCFYKKAWYDSQNLNS